MHRWLVGSVVVGQKHTESALINVEDRLRSYKIKDIQNLFNVCKTTGDQDFDKKLITQRGLFDTAEIIFGLNVRGGRTGSHYLR